MTKEEIHASLDAMLDNSKSRNFLNHLVRAYFPIANIDKVWDKPEGPFKCVLTKEELISVSEILGTIETEEFKQQFFLSIKNSLDENAPKINPFKTLLGDRLLGFTGTQTTTFMCQEATLEFYNWVITKSLKNDKHINWLLGSIRKSSFLKRAENIEDEEVQKKVQNMKKKKVEASTYTIGETDAFKKLKEKFKD